MSNDNSEGFSPDDFGMEGGEGGGAPAANVEIKPEDAANGTVGRQLDLSRMKMVLDIPLKVTVELGRTKLLINDLLQLGQGSVIELDKLAGEAMEIYINDKLVALGEVVVVNEKFGVRLTDVISNVGFSDFGPRDVA